MQRKQRGNPNWGRWQPGIKLYPQYPTEFEMLCKKLRLDPESLNQLAASEAMRKWVYKHANKKYIPEGLLDRFGIIVHVTGDLI